MKYYVLNNEAYFCLNDGDPYLSAYEQEGEVREISFQDYCLVKLKLGAPMKRNEVKEIFKKLANHPLWDRGCQEKLKELYFNMMEG